MRQSNPNRHLWPMRFRMPLPSLSWFYRLPALYGRQTATPQLVAARVSTAPAMDGKLDGPPWAMDSESGGFILLGTSSSLANAQTHVKSLTDGKDLYIGFRCDEPNISRVKPTRGPKDGGILFRRNPWKLRLIPMVMAGLSIT